MCENAVNARVPVAVPGARGSSPLLKKVAGAGAATAALGAATGADGGSTVGVVRRTAALGGRHGGVWALY